MGTGQKKGGNVKQPVADKGSSQKRTTKTQQLLLSRTSTKTITINNKHIRKLDRRKQLQEGIPESMHTVIKITYYTTRTQKHRNAKNAQKHMKTINGECHSTCMYTYRKQKHKNQQWQKGTQEDEK